MTRRDALKTLGAGAALLSVGALPSLRAVSPPEPSSLLSLPKLPYAYDALEPHIDARTMELHHSKHHQAYVANANKILEKHPDWLAGDPSALLGRLDSLPEPERTGLRNNLGGHVNHSFFWQVIGPRAGGEPKAEIGAALQRTFGGVESFKVQFADAAMKRFGSGWAWVVVMDGKLAILSTANQDSPSSGKTVPVLGLDVWEHAYYLKYQNRRADYVTAFWNVVNWERVNEFYLGAFQGV